MLPPPARRRPFVVPVTDARWCAALAEALSVCCTAPSDARVAEVRQLLAKPPESYLLPAWRELVEAADLWLENVTISDARARGLHPASIRPRFPGLRAIEAALRDKVLPVPAWAERYP